MRLYKRKLKWTAKPKPPAPCGHFPCCTHEATVHLTSTVRFAGKTRVVGRTVARCERHAKELAATTSDVELGVEMYPGDRHPYIEIVNTIGMYEV